MVTFKPQQILSQNLLPVWSESSSVKAVNLVKKSVTVTEIINFFLRYCFFYWRTLYRLLTDTVSAIRSLIILLISSASQSPNSKPALLNCCEYIVILLVDIYSTCKQCINCTLHVTEPFIKHTSAKYPKTRNAWQSLAYSPLGVVVSPPSEYLWDTPLITDHHSADNSFQANSWPKCGKIIDAGRASSYVLNSEVAELNLTKFLHNVQRWCPINMLNRNCVFPIHLGT